MHDDGFGKATDRNRHGGLGLRPLGLVERHHFRVQRERAARAVRERLDFDREVAVRVFGDDRAEILYGRDGTSRHRENLVSGAQTRLFPGTVLHNVRDHKRSRHLRNEAELGGDDRLRGVRETQSREVKLGFETPFPALQGHGNGLFADSPEKREIEVRVAADLDAVHFGDEVAPDDAGLSRRGLGGRLEKPHGKVLDADRAEEHVAEEGQHEIHEGTRRENERPAGLRLRVVASRPFFGRDRLGRAVFPRHLHIAAQGHKRDRILGFAPLSLPENRTETD